MSNFLTLLKDAIADTIGHTDGYAVMRFRYGLDGNEVYSIAEASELIGVTQKRIVDLQKDTLRRLRKKCSNDLRNGRDTPAARLMTYLRIALPGSGDKLIDRILYFLEMEFPDAPGHMAHLIVYLTIRTKSTKDVRYRLYSVERRFNQRGRLIYNPEKLLEHTIWGTHRGVWTRNMFEQKKPLTRSSDARPVFSHKVDHPVYYTTGLQQRFIRALENFPGVTFYIEHPFFFYGDNDAIRYPDLFVLTSKGNGVVVELAPIWNMARYDYLERWRNLREYCHERGMGLLITDGHYAIQEVPGKWKNRPFADAILPAIKLQPMDWKTFEVLQKQYDIEPHELTSFILKHKLKLQFAPFRIEKQVPA